MYIEIMSFVDKTEVVRGKTGVVSITTPTKIMELKRRDDDPHHIPKISYHTVLVDTDELLSEGYPEAGFFVGQSPTKELRVLFPDRIEYLQLWVETAPRCSTLFTVFRAQVYIKNDEGKTFQKITVGDPF